MVLSNMNLDGNLETTAHTWQRSFEPQVPLEVVSWPRREGEDDLYLNTGTCPECAGGMISQGGCFVCPACGFQSCLV